MELEILQGNTSDILYDYANDNIGLDYSIKHGGFHWVVRPKEEQEGVFAINDECYECLKMIGKVP